MSYKKSSSTPRKIAPPSVSYLQQALGDERQQDLAVAGRIAGDLAQPTSALLQHAGDVIFAHLQHLQKQQRIVSVFTTPRENLRPTHLQTGLVQHVRGLDLLLQLDLLLLLLVVLHDLEALLLHQAALLDVELLLGLGVDLLRLLVGLLLDEGHHVLDLGGGKEAYKREAFWINLVFLPLKNLNQRVFLAIAKKNK